MRESLADGEGWGWGLPHPHGPQPGTPCPRGLPGGLWRTSALLGSYLCFGLVTWAAAARGAEQLVLVRPGQAMPTIVVGRGGAKFERLAAEELRTYLGRMTGRELEIVEDDSAPASTYIAVGPGRLTASIDVSSLGPEQFIIDVTPERLAIVGGRVPEAHRGFARAKGTFYGAVEALDQLGVRWYRPEPWGEHVPRTGTVTFPLGRTVSPEPAYLLRSGGGYGFGWWPGDTDELNQQRARWCLRNHLTGNAPFRFYHVYSQYIPPDEYFAEHPEYFGLVDGKRDPRWQLCLGNPEVQALFAEKAIALAKAEPHWRSVSVEPDDGNPRCTCDLCRTMDDPERPNSTSDRVCKFSNIVARRLAEAVPGMKVHWLAYSGHTRVPATVDRLEPNTIIQLCTINEWGHYAKPLLGPDNGWNQRFVDALRGWGALKPWAIMTYEYWSGYGWPGAMPIVRTIADRLKHYRQFNVRGVYNEVTPHWGPQGLELYMFARLVWNPELELAGELDRYYENYYGPAAGPMEDYHEAWMDASERAPASCYSGGRGMHLACTPGLIARVGEHLRTAEALVKDRTPYARRLRGVHAGYEVARRVSEILSIKKQKGTRIEVTKGTFAGRSSYSHSAEAEEAFDDLVQFLLRFREGDPVFDVPNGPPYNVVINEMRGDVLKNAAVPYLHESALLGGF